MQSLLCNGEKCCCRGHMLCTKWSQTSSFIRCNQLWDPLAGLILNTAIISFSFQALLIYVLMAGRHYSRGCRRTYSVLEWEGLIYSLKINFIEFLIIRWRVSYTSPNLTDGIDATLVEESKSKHSEVSQGNINTIAMSSFITLLLLHSNFHVLKSHSALHWSLQLT